MLSFHSYLHPPVLSRALYLERTTLSLARTVCRADVGRPAQLVQPAWDLRRFLHNHCSSNLLHCRCTAATTRRFLCLRAAPHAPQVATTQSSNRQAPQTPQRSADPSASRSAATTSTAAQKDAASSVNSTTAPADSGSSSSDSSAPSCSVHSPRRWTFRHWEGDTIDLSQLTARRQSSVEKHDTEHRKADAKSSPSALQRIQRLWRSLSDHAATFWSNPAVLLQWTSAAWSSVKSGARHYWSGTKLLWADIRTAIKLLRKLAKKRADASHADSSSDSHSHELTWRERRQLRRTLADLARVGPFLVILIVPFMELTLPFLLKAFPDFLPSTFESKAKREKRLQQETKVRLEIAELLQEAVMNIAKKQVPARKEKSNEGSNGSAASSSSSASESSSPYDASQLLDLLSEVRHGKRISASEMARLSDLFRTSLTLQRMSRKTLTRLAKFFGLLPYAVPDAVLRYQLRRLIARLRADDVYLQAQLNSLSSSELRFACHERGIRSVGLTDEGYRRQLQSWLDLSLKYNVPDSLLLLSRPIGFLEQRPSKSAIRDALLKFDEDTLEELVPVTEEDQPTDNETRLKL
jgi:hypothetical protein